MMTARNTSWSELAGSPWSRGTRSAYNELEHVVNSELTWSAAVNLSLSTTPCAVILCTWQMSRQTGGCFTNLPRTPRPVNIISFDFEHFNCRLFSSAHAVWTCKLSSLVLVSELSAGTIRLRMCHPQTWWSHCQSVPAEGQMLWYWMTPAQGRSLESHWPWCLEIHCPRTWCNLNDHRRNHMLSGRANRASSPSGQRAWPCRMRNALLKSSANTRINGCMVSMEKMVWMTVIRAAAVEPVGLKANWSAKCSLACATVYWCDWDGPVCNPKHVK